MTFAFFFAVSLQRNSIFEWILLNSHPNFQFFFFSKIKSHLKHCHVNLDNLKRKKSGRRANLNEHFDYVAQIQIYPIFIGCFSGINWFFFNCRVTLVSVWIHIRYIFLIISSTIKSIITKLSDFAYFTIFDIQIVCLNEL